MTRNLSRIVSTFIMFLPLAVFAQGDLGAQLAELASLRNNIRNPDTRIRVSAFHRAWSIAMSWEAVEVKLNAIDLMTEPVRSASDHIRLPAVYAIAEIANSSSDQRVKLRALQALREPIRAAQLPIRNAAIDALNSIMRERGEADLANEAVSLLSEPVRSGNNGVRIPAINALVRSVLHSKNEQPYNAAIDLLVSPLDSMAMIGGMEVRMMAVVAMEEIGADAPSVATKAKAMGLMQSYANKSIWEPEARKRAADAATKIQSTIKKD
jgi:hypothetical protein